MPRGRKKKLPVDELIVQTEKEIADLKSQISEKRKELKKLKAEKENEDRERLMKAVEASGKSFEEVISLLNKNSAE